MLAGIKIGKKKQKRPAQEGGPLELPLAKKTTNRSAAQELKRALAKTGIVSSETTQSDQNLLQRIERIAKREEANNISEPMVVLTRAAVASDRPIFQKEDYRNGTRKGKINRGPRDVAGTTTEEAEWTIAEMLKEEKSNKKSMDEQFARNIARVGSRYKGTESKRSSTTGADEEDAVDTNMYRSQRLTAVASQQREQSRQVAQFDQLNSITSKCSWWMESSHFQKHLLIALGDHVSLSMAPAHASLFPGDHLYLVPIQFSDTMVGCNSDAWNEIYRFQRALREMYAEEKRGVIFLETVLQSAKGSWQTRLEAVAVPLRVAEDAPMYFKSALTEQAEEWGTHTKLLSTKNKGLQRTIPNRFAYFFVEWEAGDGFAQIIETAAFPKDFGVDTIAGMMRLDPVRFRRKQRQSMEKEQTMVSHFCSKWKPFDWTLEMK